MFSEEKVKALAEPPTDMRIVICRFLCAVFMHITLGDELRQGFSMMKYALNHPWKFVNWSRAFRVGFFQLSAVLTLEIVNLTFMLTNATIVDIIMNFIALLIIADFDDYFFMTVAKTSIGVLIKEGQVEAGDGVMSLKELTKIETTTSNRAPPDMLVNHVLEEGSLEMFKNDEKFEISGVQRKVFISFRDRDIRNKACRFLYRILVVFY